MQQRVKAADLAHLIKQEKQPRTFSKPGYREDHGVYCASQMEANMLRYYRWLQKRGDLAEVVYQPDEFEFQAIRHGVTRYRPDYWILENNGKSYFVETKGFMDAKSKTKIKRFRKHLPWYELRVIEYAEYRELAKQLKNLVPGWE